MFKLTHNCLSMIDALLFSFVVVVVVVVDIYVRRRLAHVAARCGFELTINMVLVELAKVAEHLLQPRLQGVLVHLLQLQHRLLHNHTHLAVRVHLLPLLVDHLLRAVYLYSIIIVIMNDIISSNTCYIIVVHNVVVVVVVVRVVVLLSASLLRVAYKPLEVVDGKLRLLLLQMFCIYIVVVLVNHAVAHLFAGVVIAVVVVVAVPHPLRWRAALHHHFLLEVVVAIVIVVFVILILVVEIVVVVVVVKQGLQRALCLQHFFFLLLFVVTLLIDYCNC